MKRMNFYLSDLEIVRLQNEAVKQDIAASDLLRRIIDDYFKESIPSLVCHYGQIPVSGNFVLSGNSLIII